MFVALWEFEVKPGCEERLEKVYGPRGDWRNTSVAIRDIAAHCCARMPAGLPLTSPWTHGPPNRITSNFSETKRPLTTDWMRPANLLTHRERRIGNYFSVD